MCNCGNNRKEFTSGQSAALSNPKSIPQQGKKMWPDVYFKYTGKTALTVTGKITGKNYRFSKPEEKLLIDYRDASGMMNVPVLIKAT
jgi:hypothetical protein